MPDAFFSRMGQGWPQFADLLVAFLLSSLIGLMQQIRQKDAGLRTHTLVGVGSALFMLVSKYGFADLLPLQHASIDPSRIAAQIVSGIGFIGGGVIFVRRDAVRGLTTAAIVWLTAAIGMACGAGLPLLAVAVLLIHFVTVFGLPQLAKHLPGGRPAARVSLTYYDGQGVLRAVLRRCTEEGFVVTEVEGENELTHRAAPRRDTTTGRVALSDGRLIGLTIVMSGRRPVSAFAEGLLDLPGVVAVHAHEPQSAND